jgi:serine/threonine protein kinase
MNPQVIGEGAYGCVHRPSMKCRAKSADNTVSKLMSTNNATKELSEFALIDKIDKQNKIYLGKPKICKVSNTLANKVSIAKCSSKFNPEKIDRYSLILMKYGGFDLEHFGKRVYEWTKTTENVRAIELFWIEVLRLFYGLKVFHDNGIIHHDVKPQNIVYDQKGNRLNFIDFGFMAKKKKVMKLANESEYWLVERHHWSFPLETIFLNKSVYMKYTNPAVARADAQEIAESVANNCYSFFEAIVPVNYPEKKLNKLMHTASYRSIDLLNDFHPSKYNDFLETSLDTIDSYGLGIALTYMLHRSVHLIPTQFVDGVHEIVIEMTNPNMYARLTPDQLLANYEDLLETSGLLNKHNKHIQNHLIADGKVDKNTITAEISGSEFLVIPKDAASINLEISRQCPDGKEFNPITTRCIKTCKPGYDRNALFKCVKNKTQKRSYKICPPEKQLNPFTNRCVNDCKPGYLRDKMFKCKAAGNPFD